MQINRRGGIGLPNVGIYQHPGHTNMQPTPEITVTEQDRLDFAHKMFEFARQGDAEGLAPMLERGLPPNMSNHKGDTLLILASYHGHLEASRLLLQHGADANRFNDMAQTALAGAAFKGNVEMTRLLLEFGADVNFVPPGGKTPLMFASMFNRVEIAELLLAQGADPATVSSDGMTALQLARKMGAEASAAQLEQLPV